VGDFLSDVNKTLGFRTDAHEKSAVSNFTEIRGVGAALIHANRRKDVTKLTVAFRDNANAHRDYIGACSSRV